MESGFALVFGLFGLATSVSSLWYLLAKVPNTHTPAQSAGVLPPSEKFDAGVTILVCARNEATNLCRHLPVLLEQKCVSPYEVLVVDDASDDATPDVLASFQRQYSHLRVLRIGKKKFLGKKHALTQGIASAKYDLILLTDADCQPCSSHWLHCMTAALRHNPAVEVVLGYAPCGHRADALPDTWLDRWIRFETDHTAWTYFSFAQMGLPYMGVGRNLAWRRQAFERVGGFSGHAHLLSGDDDLLVSSMATSDNTATCLDPLAFVFSEGKKTWRGWYAQKRRHLSTGASYRPVHRLLLGALALSHSGHYAALLVLTFTEWALWAWTLWAARMAVLYLGWLRVARAFRTPRQWATLPVLDAMMGIYFGLFGLILAFSRKQPAQW